MKRFIALLLLMLVPVLARADGTPTYPATQAEVNAGTVHNKYVAPDTMAGFPWVATNLSPATMTNVVNGLMRTGAALTNTLLINPANGSTTATPTNLGFLNTNDYAAAQVASGWQSAQERIPWGAQSASSTSDITNLLQSIQNLGGKFDFNYVETDQPAYQTTRVGGHLQFNTNNFAGGQTALVSQLHTNGMLWLLWYDGNAASGTPWDGTLTQFQDDMQTILSWHPDAVWMDGQGYLFNVAQAMFATNAANIPVYAGIVAASPDVRSISAGNGWRMHGDSGDIHSWQNVKEWAGYIDTNLWRFVSPGQSFFLGPEVASAPVTGGGLNASDTTTILQAMWSCNVSSAFASTPFNSYGNLLWTNSNVREIRRDPAVVAARRVLMASNCWVYLKPLGTPAGPNYALAVVNTNESATATISFNFSDLNTVQQAGLRLREPTYSVYNLKSNTWEGQELTNLTVTALGTNSYAWFKLIPGRAVTTNWLQPFVYGPTLPAVVTSNGVSRTINLPWDSDVTNFVARAQLTNSPVQAYAVQFLVGNLKQQGLWRFDALYPIVTNAPLLNVVSSSFTLVPQGTTSTNNLGIAGDGATGYWTNNFNLRTSGTYFTSNSASWGVYGETASPTDGGIFCGASDGTYSEYLQRSGSNLSVIWHPVATGPGGVTDFRGIIMGSLINNGTGQFGYSSVSPAASVGAVSRDVFANTPFFLGAYNNNNSAGFFTTARYSLAWIGGGFTVSECGQLQNIADEYQLILGRKAP